MVSKLSTKVGSVAKSRTLELAN